MASFSRDFSLSSTSASRARPIDLPLMRCTSRCSLPPGAVLNDFVWYYTAQVYTSAGPMVQGGTEVIERRCKTLSGFFNNMILQPELKLVSAVPQPAQSILQNIARRHAKRLFLQYAIIRARACGICMRYMSMQRRVDGTSSGHAAAVHACMATKAEHHIETQQRTAELFAGLFHYRDMYGASRRTQS